MMKAVATAVETADHAAGQSGVQPLYLEALTWWSGCIAACSTSSGRVDRRGRADINSAGAAL
jgi:hypothetical protein